MGLDDRIKKECYANDMGCTACVVLITPKQIYCANAGDSRSIITKGG